MKAGKPFVVSFGSIQTATSSFVNAAFVRLLKDFSFEDVKARMRVIDSDAPNQPYDLYSAGVRRPAGCLTNGHRSSWAGTRL